MVDQRDIVINCFGNTTNRDPDVFLSKLVLEVVDSAMITMSTDDVELVDTFLLKSLDHFWTIEASSGGTENGTSKILDTLGIFRRELGPVLREFLVEASITPPDAPYLFDSVLISKTSNESFDNGVEARTKSTTSDNGCFDIFALKDDILHGTSSQELEARLQLDDILEVLLLHNESVRIQKRFVRPTVSGVISRFPQRRGVRHHIRIHVFEISHLTGFNSCSDQGIVNQILLFSLPSGAFLKQRRQLVRLELKEFIFLVKIFGLHFFVEFLLLLLVIF